MIRNRGAAIIVQEGKIALIKRIREGETYYVFPGGGIEEGETPEEAAKREAYVHIEVEHLITKVEYKGTEYYFNADIIGGVFGSGKAAEFELKDRGIYLPLWLPIHELKKVNIKPYEVVGSIFNHYKIKV
ncbi:NUDIX domain-containing protein [Bacillus sp. MHSD_36]|uniref:NUDIX hydrolase n=1 Tax=unclassified Bacillus (in: firmicutes) TaxID=185979 RepID=UPI00274119A4|nr:MULTISPECIES: NUDIX domain-containing protein [unclassified Bacillus (in: firmicutes)]MDD1369121.1 NUDIX domain-containing protein [Bacillus sp. MHSD17]MDP7988444.1 NUDIX domain-containing protein [Bacillus sp. MHSD_36]MDR4978280.1 NUDIX domain-containing protein [Bacillus sp. MHSD_37]